jgi:hypothetical protein
MTDSQKVLAFYKYMRRLFNVDMKMIQVLHPVKSKKDTGPLRARWMDYRKGAVEAIARIRHDYYNGQMLINVTNGGSLLETYTTAKEDQWEALEKHLSQES